MGQRNSGDASEACSSAHLLLSRLSEIFSKILLGKVTSKLRDINLMRIVLVQEEMTTYQQRLFKSGNDRKLTIS